MGRTAIWIDISSKLQGEIASGQRQPGDKLPTEAELSARFGVNRHTVRRALADLADHGLVHARRGAGVFVQARPLDYPLGRRTRLSANLAAMGREPGRQLLSIETRRADQAEAAALGLTEAAAVHAVEGISMADGLPIARFRSVFPAARFPGLPDALRQHQSITKALHELGVTDYTRAETRLTATCASAAMASQLRLREGDPLLQSVAINIDRDAAPVEYGHTWFVGERVTLTIAGHGGDN